MMCYKHWWLTLPSDNQGLDCNPSVTTQWKNTGSSAGSVSHFCFKSSEKQETQGTGCQTERVHFTLRDQFWLAEGGSLATTNTLASTECHMAFHTTFPAARREVLSPFCRIDKRVSQCFLWGHSEMRTGRSRAWLPGCQAPPSPCSVLCSAMTHGLYYTLTCYLSLTSEAIPTLKHAFQMAV